MSFWLQVHHHTKVSEQAMEAGFQAMEAGFQRPEQTEQNIKMTLI